MRDNLPEIKERQRRIWGSTIGLRRISEYMFPATLRLIEWLEIGPGDRVLDVATGTGRAAVAARMTGASVTAQDLSPVLLGEAAHYAQSQGFDDIQFSESDVEDLPFPNASFTVAISTFGAIHAPRGDVAAAEMDRVLVTTGRMGLATWHHACSLYQLTQLIAAYQTTELRGIDPSEWGRRERVREFISQRFFPDLEFEEGEIDLEYPSPEAAWRDWSRNYGPIHAVYQAVPFATRREIDRRGAEYFRQYIDSTGVVLWTLQYLLVKGKKISLTDRLG